MKARLLSLKNELEKKRFLLQLAVWRRLEDKGDISSPRQKLSTITDKDLTPSRLWARMLQLEKTFPFMSVNTDLLESLLANELEDMVVQSRSISRCNAEGQWIQDNFSPLLEGIGAMPRPCQHLMFTLAGDLSHKKLVVLGPQQNALFACEASTRARRVFTWVDPEEAGLLDLLREFTEQPIEIEVSGTVESDNEDSPGKLREGTYGGLLADFTLEPVYFDQVWTAFESLTASKKLILVPNRFLTPSRTDDPILRMDILLSGELKAIIDLPLWLTGRNRPTTSLLLFDQNHRTGEIALINVSEDQPSLPPGDESAENVRILCETIDQLLSGNSKSSDVIRISSEKCRDNAFNFSFEHYRRLIDEKSFYAFLRTVNTKQLGDIAELCRPQSVYRDRLVGQGEKFREAMVSDIRENGLLGFPAKEIELFPFAFREKCFLLRENDILLTLKGSVGQVALVPKEVGDNWFPNQSFVILRLREDQGLISPIILFLYLRSVIGHSEIVDRTTKGRVPFLRLEDLRSIRVPIPSNKNQTLLMDGFAKSKTLYERIESLRSDAVRALGDPFQLFR